MKELVVNEAAVDFQPNAREIEILQNVRTIVGTRKGTVPLDRDFGISWEHVDKPLPVVEMLMRAEIVEAVEKYEPRAKVTKVEFSGAADEFSNGQVSPIVTIAIKGEEDNV